MIHVKVSSLVLHEILLWREESNVCLWNVEGFDLDLPYDSEDISDRPFNSSNAGYKRVSELSPVKLVVLGRNGPTKSDKFGVSEKDAPESMTIGYSCSCSVI